MTDAGMFEAGRQEERYRLQILIDARIDDLQRGPKIPSLAAACSELLRLRRTMEQTNG
jgi:hypothetical protein